MNKASESSVGIGNVNPVRRSETIFNKTSWVAVGASALTVEVAECWGFSYIFGNDAGDTGSL